jgi:fructokinase
VRIISIGEILFDVYDYDEHIGGAPFNYSVHINRLGHEVYFISAVGEDMRGDRALQYISDHGLSTKFINIAKGYPTGHVGVVTDKGGQPSYIIDRPVAYDFPSLTSEQINDIISFKPDLLYFGTVQQMSVAAKELICTLIELLPKTKCFYDMNLRDGHYTLELVKELLKVSSILKLNNEEAQICCELFDKKSMELKNFCKWIVDEFELEGVCITMGPDGCAVYFNGEYFESPGYQVEIVDPVGAGDAFAAGFLHGLSKNWKMNKACDFANRLGALNIKKKGAIPDWMIEEVFSLKSNN